MKTLPQAAGIALCTALLVVQAACGSGPRATSSGAGATIPQVANLHAFARLYGLVRWFHPSDAASKIDWDRFAIEGAHRVVDAPDRRTLRARLMVLFGPVAPTMHIVEGGETYPDEPALRPKSSVSLDLVAWQHKGYGDTTVATGYSSKRLHRDNVVPVGGARFAAFSQTLDATQFRGSQVRLRGKLRAGKQGRAQLWLRVDRGDAEGFFDNMATHPVRSERWTSAEIIGTVAPDSTRIVFGVLNNSRGAAWYDDLQLAVASQDGAWTPIVIADDGFEAPDMAAWQAGIAKAPANSSTDGWHVVIDTEAPAASGKSSLKIEPITTTITKELFDKALKPGETVDVDLGSGLRARVPIVLYSEAGRTLGDDPEVARLAEATWQSAESHVFDALSGAADVIVFWNVLEHFWPYWNSVSIDWNSALDDALARSLDDHQVDHHVTTLERLSAKAPDGHVSLQCPGESRYAYVPFSVDVVESQVVVTHSDNTSIKRGDVIVSIDHRSVVQLLAEQQELISGSSQWRVLQAGRRLGRGSLGSSALLRLLRGGVELTVRVQRIDHRVTEDPSNSPVTRFADGTYYVDLSRVTTQDIDPIIDHLAVAPGVVFDLRRYPKRNHDILSHLLTRQDVPKGWELVPLIVRPDSGSTPEAWEDTSSWNMPLLTERKPHIEGRVAFLTGSGAVSYAESVMALVEYYQLGEIVGAATAGTNGDVAEVTLPTGCKTLFTGRRVLRPDGRRHHLVGIQPTIPTSRTIAGVIAGHDEILERALAYVRSGSR